MHKESRTLSYNYLLIYNFFKSQDQLIYAEPVILIAFFNMQSEDVSECKKVHQKVLNIDPRFYYCFILLDDKDRSH